MEPVPTIVTLGEPDRAAMLAHLQGLSAQDLALRFLQAYRPDQAGGLVERMLERGRAGRALNFGVRDPAHGGLLVMGMLAPYVPAGATADSAAELSLSVAPAARGRGYTRVVIAWALERARSEGRQRLTLYFSEANERIRKVVGDLRLPVVVTAGRGVVHIDLDAKDAGAASPADEQLRQLFEAAWESAASRL